MQLFDAEGRRLYFTEEERRAFVAAAAQGPACCLLASFGAAELAVLAGTAGLDDADP